MHGCMCKNKHDVHFLRMIRRPHAPRTYQVPGARYLYGSSSYCCRCSLQQARTPIVQLYKKGDTVTIERRPPSPSTWRLCARSSQTLLRPQASGDGTRMQSVIGESRASCRPCLNISGGRDPPVLYGHHNAFLEMGIHIKKVDIFTGCRYDIINFLYHINFL